MTASSRHVTASWDGALSATVVSRRSLLYRGGPDDAEDRPAHVRAASGVAWVGPELAVVSDDSLFVSLVDPNTGLASAIALPRGPGGLRLFDDRRGNKKEKLDLESCCVFSEGGVPCLLAFGSGSAPARERIVRVRFAESGPEVTVLSRSSFYAALRACTAFAGSELNVEGIAKDGDVLRLFQRGNGAPRLDLGPVNATAAVSFPALLRHLDGDTTLPELGEVTTYTLGEVEGTRLTFTDGASAPRGTAFLASAEASPDAVRDGPVTGSAVGVLQGDVARIALLREDGGAPFLAKAEGLVLFPDDPTRAFLVVDADDPDRPSELCEIRLRGPWF